MGINSGEFSSLDRRQAEKTSSKKMLLNNFLSSFHGICLKVFAIVILSPSFSHFTWQCYTKKKTICSSQRSVQKVKQFSMSPSLFRYYSMSAWLQSKMLVAICVLFDFCTLESESRENFTQFYY